MMRPPPFALSLIVAGVTPALASAQPGSCPPEVTVAECIALLERGAAAVRGNAGVRVVSERVESRSTGLGVGRAGTSIADFLPLLATMLSGPPGDAAEALAVDFVLRPDFDPVRPGGQAFRVRAIRHAPEPYAPLLASLPDSVRVEQAASLREGLGEFADLEVRLAWNLESATFGRTADHHRDLLSDVFSEIVADAERRAGLAGVANDPAAVSALLNELDDGDFADGCDPADAGDPRALRLDCLKPGPRARLVQALRGTLAGEAMLDSLVRSALDTRGFFRLGDLINDQPQLNVEGHGRLRDSLVGPETWGVDLRFEMGFVNVNRFRAYCRAQAPAKSAGTCLSEYLALPGVTAALGRGDRVWLSASYERTGRYAAALALAPGGVIVPGSHALTVAGGLGRYIGETKGAFEAGRVDVEGSYVFRKDDEVREDRLVASLTYTQRLTDGASLVLGLEYANKPEFLGEVDSKVSANFGVRYALHPPGGSE